MKQITEDYCSFEIAQLLKEKGFDERGLCVYTVEEERFYTFGDWVENSCLLHHLISAPTHQMALKWLRENNLYIEIRRNLNTFYFRWKVEQGAADKAVSEYKYDTYEEAVEAALKYTLENLI